MTLKRGSDNFLHPTRPASAVAYSGGVDKANGALDAEKGKKGWRWTFTSANGAFFLGPSRHKTKAMALEAGQDWLASRA